MPDSVPYGLPPGEADTRQGVPPHASNKTPSTGADYGLPPGETTAQYGLPPGESNWLGGMLPSHVQQVGQLEAPKGQYDWSSLGAQTKKELPGYLFLSNGVTVNQNNNKVWVPSQKQWFTPLPDGSITPDSNQIIPPTTQAMRDELASANEVGRHIVSPTRLPEPQQANGGMLPSYQRDETALRSMFLRKAAEDNAPLSGTYQINPSVSGSTLPEQMRAAGIKPTSSGPSHQLVQFNPVTDEDSTAQGYVKSVVNAIPEEINSTYSGLSGLTSVASGLVGMDNLSKRAANQSQASAEVSTDEGMTGGQEAVNFLAKFPLMMARMAGEAAFGIPPAVGESLLAGGSKYAQAKASGASDKQALAAAGITSAGNRVFFALGGKAAKGMTVPKELAVRGLTAVGLGSLANLIDAGATATYDVESAKKQAKSPEAYAKSIAQFGAFEGLGMLHGRLGSSEAPKPETPESLPDVAAPRTRESIHEEMKQAAASGDTARLLQLKSEAESLAPDSSGMGRIELDLPETNAGDVKPTEPPTAQPEDLPNKLDKRFGLQEGLESQSDTIDALYQRREQLLTDIQSAQEQATKARRTRGPEGRRIAQKTFEGLRNELADVEDRISQNTGKAPGEMGLGTTNTDNSTMPEQPSTDSTGSPIHTNPEVAPRQMGSDAISAADQKPEQIPPTSDHPPGEPNAGLGKPEYKGGDIADMFGLGSSYEATMNTLKRSLDLPLEAKPSEVASAVMERIGHLGASVKETAVRIMSKIKGITRDVANAIAEHLHQAVSGSRESQLGMARLRGNGSPEESLPLLGGPEEAAPTSKVETNEQKAPSDELKAQKAAHRQEFADALKMIYPGDSPEDVAARHAAWSKYRYTEPTQAKAQEPTQAPAPVQEAVKPVLNRIAAGVKARLAGNEGGIGKAYKMFNDLIDGMHPSGASDKALLAATEIHHAIGKRGSAELRAQDAFGKIAKTVDALPDDQKLQMIHAIEAPGHLVEDSPLAVSINKLKDVNDAMGQTLTDRGIIEAPLSDYFHRVWEKNDAFDEYQKYLKRSLSGNKGYTKSRTLDMTVQEAMEKFPGLKLKDNNPFRVALADLANKQKMITAQDALQRMDKNGLVQWHPSDEQPRGMVAISDGLFTEARDIDGKRVMGHYYATPDVARVLNNYINPGFEQHPKLNNYLETFRNIENAQVAMQMGLSMFHGTFVTNDIIANKINIGLQRLVQDGDIKGFGKAISEALGSPVGAVRTAEQAKAAVLGQLPPELQKQWAPIVDGLERGGMKFTSEHENMINAADRLSTEAAKMRAKYGKVIGTAAMVKNPVTLALATVEQVAKPLMQYYVPMAKIGVFAEEYREFLRRNPVAGETQRNLAARNISKRIEDRLGQVSYDNMNLNKFARQIAFMAVRATGWDVGSLKVALAPQGEAVQALGHLATKATGGKLIDAPMPNPEGLAHPWATNRMTYLVASSVLAAMVSQITRSITHAIHPEVPSAPDSIKDIFYPRVGGKDASGRDKRVAVPGYMGKELPEIWHIENEAARGNLSPAFGYLWSKVHPTPKTIFSLISGKDWQGNDIFERSTEPFFSAQHAKDAAQNAGRMGKFLAKEMTPYSVSNLLGGRPGYDSKADVVRQFMGFVQPKTSMLDTASETYLSERRAESMKKGATPDQAEQRNTIRDLTTKFANGDTKSAFDAVKKGIITPQQMEKIEKDAGKLTSQTHIDRLLEDASFDDMYNASNLSSDKVEMEKIVNAMGDKLSKPDINLTPQKAVEEQQKFSRAQARLKAMK